MLCPPPPAHDPANVRRIWPALAERVEALQIPDSGLTRREFERLAFDWAEGWERVPFEDRDHLLSRLHRERLISRVDVFGEIDRIYSPHMPRQFIHQAMRLRRDTPSRNALTTAFRTIAHEVGRAYFWLTFKSAGASEADLWEGDRNIRHHAEAAREAVKAMLAKGATLDEARLYLPEVFDPVILDRITMALPFLSQESTDTVDDVFPAPEPRIQRGSPLERALALIGEEMPKGVKKSDLRRAIFSNNSAGFDAFIRELSGHCDEVIRKPALGSGGGRPAVFFVLRGGPVQEIIDEETRLRRMNDPFDNSIIEPMPQADRFSNPDDEQP